MTHKPQLSTRISNIVWLLQVLYVCLGTAIPINATSIPNNTTVDGCDRKESFGPTSISSLVVAIFGSLFGLLALISFWLWKTKRSGTGDNNQSNDITADQPPPDNQPNIDSSALQQPDSSTSSPDSNTSSPDSSNLVPIQADSAPVTPAPAPTHNG